MHHILSFRLSHSNTRGEREAQINCLQKERKWEESGERIRNERTGREFDCECLHAEIRLSCHCHDDDSAAFTSCSSFLFKMEGQRIRRENGILSHTV